LYESPGWISSASISPKGNLIAFDEHPRMPYIQGWIAVIDMSGQKRILSSGWAAASVAMWSREDEVWFAGTRKGGINNEAIQAVTLAGKERLVWQGFGGLANAAISPDRRSVLVTRSIARAHISGIFGTATGQRDLSWFDWSTVADLSPDGQTLLFYEWGAGAENGPTVYLRKTDGSDAVRLGDGRALGLSPDGKWALAVQEATQKLVMLPTGAGEQKTLPMGVVSEVYWASWSANGREILFAGAERGHLPRTYIQNLDSGTLLRATSEGMVGVLVSPDGKLIAAYGPDGDYYLAPIGGGEPHTIPGMQQGDTPIQWSTDGGAIYVRATGDFEVKIYSVNLTSGRRTFLLKLSPPDQAGMFGIAADPRGVRMTPDGKSVVYTYWSAIGELYLLEGLK
jgi:Tol biopolymer transport system component